MGLNLEGPFILKVNEYVHYCQKYGKCILLMFDYTSNDARVIIWTSSVQTDTCEWKPHIFACESGWLKWQKPCPSWPGAVFFSVKVTCCASVKSEYGCLVTKYFKQKLHESQNSNLCFMSNSTTVIYMHLGFHGKATVMVFDLQQFVILATSWGGKHICHQYVWNVLWIKA